MTRLGDFGIVEKRNSIHIDADLEAILWVEERPNINEAAVSLALNSSSAKARDRFHAQGRLLKMVPDVVPTPNGGPWFIWNYLQFEDKKASVEVQSWSSFTPLDGLAYGAGTHYCKLLSPARALEWIYTDSLRTQTHD